MWTVNCNRTCKLCIVKSKLKTEVRIILSIGNFGSDCAVKSALRDDTKNGCVADYEKCERVTVNWQLQKLKTMIYAKLWGDKQRALWYVMVFSGAVNCNQEPKVPYMKQVSKNEQSNNKF